MYKFILLTLAFIGAITTCIATIVLFIITVDYILKVRRRNKDRKYFKNR